jgi:DNA adenine methylase
MSVSKKKIRPLIKIHGGSYYYADWIISHFPHNHEYLDYFEMFLGGGSVYLNKKCFGLVVLNEKNPELFKLWNDVLYHTDYIVDSLKALEYKQETFEWAKKYSSTVATFAKYRMSRGGLCKSFAWSDRLRGGKPGDVNAWETSIKNISNVVCKMINDDMILSNYDFVSEYIESYIKSSLNSPENLFFLDPPFVPKTRTAKKCYEYEMTYEQHEVLVNGIKDAKAYVCLLGYDNKLYNGVLSAPRWNKVSKQVTNNSGQNSKKQKRQICLWRNYVA